MAAGTVLIIIGGLVTVFTPLGFIGIALGAAIGAAGLDVLA